MLPRGLMLRIIQADQAGRAKARQEDWPRRRPEGTG
jgi:hypothetical protein